MKEILIFAGTTEGRRLSEILDRQKIKHTLCVATKYGEEILKSTPNLTVNCDRMDEEAMKDFIRKNDFALVVDATHPYAKEVTANIRAAVSDTNVPYIRIKRNTRTSEAGNVRFFESVKECAMALKEVSGNILLTTGSKDLKDFVSEGLTERIFARVIPSEESIKICEDLGIKGRHIIAMQGPFSETLNEALIDEFNISAIVSKQSGSVGGFDEKIKAAVNKNILTFVIGCDDEEGLSIKEACTEIGKIIGSELNVKNRINVTLAGIGPGEKRVFTQEMTETVNNADFILGAERMLENIKHTAVVKPYYKASEIIPFIEELMKDNLKDEINVAVLFSGDTSFYSGASSLYEKLNELKAKSDADIKIDILPGISSVSYMCSKLGMSINYLELSSLHGKDVINLSRKIMTSKGLFFLLSGVKDVNRLGRSISAAGLEKCSIYLGYRLSYEDESIEKLTAKECEELSKEGLYSCIVINEDAIKKNMAPGLSDEEFIRGKVPMSKEEIREVSICKLGLKNDSVLYDIGSGTGSVAVECALLSDDIKVFAIECKDEALELINANKNKFLLENIEVIKALAPDGLKELPKATHAFIGGSKGNLKEILKTLREINPDMKVVINAISLETIGELSEVLKEFEDVKADIVQIQVSKSDVAGSYHLMKAQNPVYICTISFGN